MGTKPQKAKKGATVKLAVTVTPTSGSASNKKELVDVKPDSTVAQACAAAKIVIDGKDLILNGKPVLPSAKIGRGPAELTVSERPSGS